MYVLSTLGDLRSTKSMVLRHTGMQTQTHLLMARDTLTFVRKVTRMYGALTAAWRRRHTRSRTRTRRRGGQMSSSATPEVPWPAQLLACQRRQERLDS